MKAARRISLFWLTCWCALGGLGAQTPLPDPARASHVLDASPQGDPERQESDHSPVLPVHMELSPEGAVRGRGPGYFATVDGGEFAFGPGPSPSTGTPASELRFRTECVLRETGARIRTSAAVRPRAEMGSTTAHLDHGSFEERFELRSRGVKHSYVFPTRPAGGGDLIVRLALNTLLEAHRRPSGGLWFGPEGAIRISRVVGIDALGETCEGSISVSDHHLEMRLPGEFVDRAALPLELDPWIHSQTDWQSFDGDIAYLNTADRYLLCWTASEGVKAVLTDGIGRALTPARILDSAGERPRCAAVSMRDRFVVAWAMRSGLGLRLASVSGLDGSASAAISLGGVIDHFDLGGDSTLTDDEAVLVYDSPGKTFGQQVHVRADGSLYLFGRRELLDLAAAPRLPATGGDVGRYLVVCRTTIDLRGLVIDRNLNILDVGLTQTTRSWHKPHLDVDGDGTTWLVAWGEFQLVWGNDQIAMAQCRTATFDASRNRLDWSSARRLLEQRLYQPEGVFDPSVAWLGESATVAFVHDRRIVRHSVNSVDCNTCETRRTLSVDWTAGKRAPVASKFSSRMYGQRGNHLVGGLTLQRDFWSGRYYGAVLTVSQTARDGLVTPMSHTGCGAQTQGHIDVACAAVYKNMTVRLREATPNQSCWLLISDRQRLLSCGACTVGPYLLGDTYPARTDAAGTAQVRISVPTIAALVGTNLYAQWWVSIAGSSGCLGAYLSPGATLRLE